MKTAIALLLLCSTASAQTTFMDTSQWSREYAQGWCAGYTHAQQVSIRNRNHYRAMLKFPAETLEESMKRIYAKWPPEPPAGYVADNIVTRGVVLEMAGIDLYVVLPPLGGSMGSIQMKIADGVFTCPELAH